MARMRAVWLLVGLPLVLAAPAAAASCAYPHDSVRLSEHELVFAGEVVGTSDGDRTAEVRVLDVWRGRDLPPQVVVFGGSDDGQSSVDRVFESGRTYAFFAYEDEDGVLRDNACTATASLSERAAVDPAGVRAPVPDAPAPADPRTPAWLWPAGATTVVVAAMAAGLLRRRRTT